MHHYATFLGMPPAPNAVPSSIHAESPIVPESAIASKVLHTFKYTLYLQTAHHYAQWKVSSHSATDGFTLTLTNLTPHGKPIQTAMATGTTESKFRVGRVMSSTLEFVFF